MSLSHSDRSFWAFGFSITVQQNSRFLMSSSTTCRSGSESNQGLIVTLKKICTRKSLRTCPLFTYIIGELMTLWNRRDDKIHGGNLNVGTQLQEFAETIHILPHTALNDILRIENLIRGIIGYLGATVCWRKNICPSTTQRMIVRRDLRD